MYYRRIPLWGFALLLLISENLHADESRPFLIAIPSFPPFYFAPQSENATGSAKKGIAILYVDALAKKLDFPVEVRHIPYARIANSLENGEIDGAIMFKNREVENTAQYIGPVSTSKVMIYPAKDVSIKTYQDLYKMNHIAVVRGANFDNRFDNDDHLMKYFVKDYTQGVSMFKRKRADGIIGALEGLDYNLKQANITASEYGQRVYLSDKEVWLHISNTSSYVNEVPTLSSAVKSLYQPYLFYSLYMSELSNNDSFRIGDIPLIK